MNNNPVIVGNAPAALASPRKGWVMGWMFPRDDLAHTDDFEIKTWRHEVDENYGAKIFLGVEWFNVEHGAIEVAVWYPQKDGNWNELPDEKVVLKGERREHILIPYGVKKSVRALGGPAWGVTVRSPSHPTANVVMGK